MSCTGGSGGFCKGQAVVSSAPITWEPGSLNLKYKMGLITTCLVPTTCLQYLQVRQDQTTQLSREPKKKNSKTRAYRDILL